MRCGETRSPPLRLAQRPRLGPCSRRGAIAGVGERGRDYGRPVREVRAAGVRRKRHVGQRSVAVGVGEVGIPAGQLGQRLGRARRDCQEMARPVLAIDPRLPGGRLLDDDMGIGAAESKGVRPARRGSAAPGQGRTAVAISIGDFSIFRSGLIVRRCRCGGISP